MNKIFKIVILIVFSVILSSCKNENNFYGYYEMDKYGIGNRNNNSTNYRILKINKNNTFELRYNRNDSVSVIKGSLDYENYYFNKYYDKKVIFHYNGKKIIGTLRGTIFHFRYPNEFHNGKFSHVLYVKLKI